MPITAPTIYSLLIERFRGIQSLSWKPSQGVNLILGGGDAGKTTLLDAIALLFSPTNPTTLADTDYYCRKVGEGFTIEAVVALPSTASINRQTKPSWPWCWNGSEPVVPSAGDDAAQPVEPVYRLRVRGTADLELAYEIVQPDDSLDAFSVSLRRSIGLVRLSGDDRNDRDLRLVQGSALDHLLSDPALRSRLAAEFSKGEVKDVLIEDSKKALINLDAEFKKQNLPSGLGLAITGGQGLSIAALIGLTATLQDVQLPLPTWGAGTRRMAALTIAEHQQGEAPITIVDEIERGLEPYRQRLFMDKLQRAPSQAFVTTHSPAAISAAATAELWYVDHIGKVGSLEATKLARLRAKDPDTFLSRLAIVAEGATEVGFLTALLEKALAPLSLQQCGIHVSDGEGHEEALAVLEALAASGLRFAGFADDEEGRHPERWNRVKQKLDALLFRWDTGCIETNVVAALPDDRLLAFITDPAAEKTGDRLRTLADRLAIEDKAFESIQARAGKNLRALILQAALGKVPAGSEAQKKELKAHAGRWFKSVDGGRELFEKLYSLDLWATFKPHVMPFANAIRQALELDPIGDIGP